MPLFWSNLTAWVNGRRDGKDAIPSKQATALPQWEKDLKNRYEATMRTVARGFDSKEAVWSQEYKAAMERAEKVQAQVGKHEIDLATNDQRLHLNAKIRRTSYYVWLFILLLGELPINWVVFDLFQDAKVLTYCLALVLAGC